MKVLIVLYEGFTEYEYQIPILAFHHFGVPFETVGLEALVVTGMIGLKASFVPPNNGMQATALQRRA
ncbi:MAG: DJ-1/PfpI family protein [Chloroflexi bacterium]|nr:DJ-1/PfpI family protein [Chloroflexota bacterium]MCL5273847.1 DJ-1/PfpI family protein [Chloroflexota bacterium]